MLSNISVTVLLPVYNGEEYLREAIDSILAQTYTDFELLIINDGSTDGTERIILSYTDPRIVYVKNEENIKLIASLNKGIDLAKGKYIAHMDADDVSLNNRLKKQIMYMEANPLIGLCGSYTQSLGLEQEIEIQYRLLNDEIKFKLFFDTHFPHPAAVIKKSVLTENNLYYEKEYIHVEDYVLWNKMANFTQLAIIPEVLVLKREHTAQVSVQYRDIQQKIMSAYRKDLVVKLVPQLNDNDYTVYEKLIEGIYPSNKNDSTKLVLLLEKLVQGNNKLKIYNTTIFNTHFYNLAYSIVYNSAGLGYAVFSTYKNTIFYTQKPFAENIKLAAKYIVRKTPKYPIVIKTI